ncbi:MAG TPA: ABC transporter permease [Stellaceae bacterium]|nr:ABC transporter permease [Stellaceae bacterium]
MHDGLRLGIRLFLFNRRRFAIAVAAVAVAAMIMFLEYGFLSGVLEAQSNIADLMRVDLVAMDSLRQNMHRWDSMRAVRLDQIAAVPGVAQVIPIYEDWAGLHDDDDRRTRRIMVFAIPPDQIPFAIGDTSTLSRWLKMPHGFLFDRLARPMFGDLIPGRGVDIDNTKQDLLGYVHVGSDLVVDGVAVMSIGDWLARHPNAQPIMGGIRVSPGFDPLRVRQEILSRIPYGDTIVMTPAELRSRENSFTLDYVPIGVIFAVGMVAGLVIGAVTCYQLLFNEVLDRLAQFATLKAMGFSNAYLCVVVAGQALFLSLIGFAAGFALTEVTDAYVSGRTMLPIHPDPVALAIIFPLTVGMCIVAGLAAMGRVISTDPAELY